MFASLQFRPILSWTIFVWMAYCVAGQETDGHTCMAESDSTDVRVICNSTYNCKLPKNITILSCHDADKNAKIADWLCSKDLENLRVIDLARSNLKEIPIGCFSTFPSLEILKISNNENLGLKNLYNACYGLNQTSLKELYANNINQVSVTYPFPRNISLLLSNTSLEKLELGYNEIQSTESGAIYYLPRTLQNVYVRGNRFEVSPVFLELVWLKNLTKLDMSFQCTTHYYRSRSKRRAEFENSNNTNTDDVDCKKLGAFDVLSVLPSSLETLVAIGMITGQTCIPPSRTSGNSRLKDIDISRDGYYRWIGPIKVNASTNQIEKLNISHNQCSFIEDGFFDQLRQLKILDVSNNLLGPFFQQERSKNVFKFLIRLEVLNMSDNKISYLPNGLLRRTSSLRSLTISNNLIETWTLDISGLDDLSYVDVSYNKLATLPLAVREKLDKNQNVTLDFLHNKILCTCENMDFLDWIFTSKVLVRLAYNDKCTGYNGNITQAYQYLRNECKKDNSVREWLYPVQTMCILFILSVLALIMYKKRWAIIYHWYLFRLRRKGYTPIEGYNDGYQYDAFLSFADEDRPFVDQVVTKLEENMDLQFQVCVHYRDFIPGRSISNNIVSSIHTSKKTVVFISRAYLKSSWCKYELQMAISEESHMNRRVIIMIVLEEDIPHRSLPLEVMHYYRTTSYITKPSNEQEMTLFWEALRVVLTNEL